MANLHAGCVVLYVKKGAKLRYSTIENWSKNMYNLNTKRALVEEGGVIEWVSGSFGSHVGCLYPMSILKGDNSRMEFTGVTFAGAGQDLDTGAKVVHVPCFISGAGAFPRRKRKISWPVPPSSGWPALYRTRPLRRPS